MNIHHRVELSQTERGPPPPRGCSARRFCWLRMPAPVTRIASSVRVGGSTVYRTKRRFVVGNRGAAQRPHPGADRKVSGKEEALLVATAGSNPPEGRAHWTLELLAGELSGSPSTATSLARPRAVVWRKMSSSRRSTASSSPA